jgi:hypothetical protein
VQRISTTMLVLMIAACGPGKGGESTGSETDATSSGTTNETSTASGTGPTSTTSPTGTSTAPTTGGDACEAFMSDTDDLGPPVKLTLVNTDDDQVFVSTTGCGGLPAISLLDADQRDRLYAGSSCSPDVCQEFLGADSCSPICDNCAPPFGRLIQPGGSFEMNWPGVLAETATMTAECAPGTDCQRDCAILRKAEPGTYSFGITFFKTCTGTCVCDEIEGVPSCPLWQQVEFGAPVEIAVPFDYPAVTEVELKLGP